MLDRFVTFKIFIIRTKSSKISDINYYYAYQLWGLFKV